jgi:cytosine/creatinine deaminase
MGVEVVGGIPHFERTMEDGRRSVTELCEIAAERGLRVDMHCDETDDPMSRHVEQLAYETQRLGLQGRVNGSHLTSMHSMDNYYVSKLLPLMAEAEVSAVPNPLINIVIQGRHDTYPKRRGMTRVPEMLAHGIRVGFGQDCVLDPWYPAGHGRHAGRRLHGPARGADDEPRRHEALLRHGDGRERAIMGLDDYGLSAGKKASLVVLDAGDPVEAIRLRAQRLYVIASGKVVSERPAAHARLSLPGRPETVSRRHQI